jgi:hypothetical protein
MKQLNRKKNPKITYWSFQIDQFSRWESNDCCEPALTAGDLFHFAIPQSFVPSVLPHGEMRCNQPVGSTYLNTQHKRNCVTEAVGSNELQLLLCPTDSMEYTKHLQRPAPARIQATVSQKYRVSGAQVYRNTVLCVQHGTRVQIPTCRYKVSWRESTSLPWKRVP